VLTPRALGPVHHAGAALWVDLRFLLPGWLLVRRAVGQACCVRSPSGPFPPASVGRHADREGSHAHDLAESAHRLEHLSEECPRLCPLSAR
jgi:hypothetical protein